MQLAIFKIENRNASTDCLEGQPLFVPCLVIGAFY